MGDVRVSGYVIVMPGAVVDGNVTAREIYLGGLVKGHIETDRLYTYEAGFCAGRIKAKHREREL